MNNNKDIQFSISIWNKYPKFNAKYHTQKIINSRTERIKKEQENNIRKVPGFQRKAPDNR